MKGMAMPVARGGGGGGGLPIMVSTRMLRPKGLTFSLFLGF